jgi:cell division protein FtsB
MVTRGHRLAAARLRARQPKVRRPPPSRRRQVLMVCAAVVAVWGTVAFVGQYARTYALAREAAQLDQRRQTLVVRNEQLREEIGRLQTDNAYIEHLARTELGLVRPGEIEFMLVPNGHTQPPDGAGAGSDAPDPTAGTDDQHAGWFDRLMARLSSLLSRFRR